ncbi:Flp pilus assembly protein TadB [Friedmanniella endophytica]|uniref:Flp pilus assembly protein TadB n=1 Tax=Microlunatus kandeliicorticis TaxID=1759536 RepID=A0A7W3IQZ0_9ACTN|nr:type II secretion system F family protein [Microlunatus kandeliicorticis]MBA8793598.1 Flp pilus assembly protein TadB [Microlunatus kandeliicorticis]
MTGAVGAALCGAALVFGVLAIVRGLRRSEPTPARTGPRTGVGLRWARLTRRPSGPAGRRRDLVLLGATVAGVLVAALTGWVVAVLLFPMAALVLPLVLVAPKPRDVELLEALDRWVRTLSAALPTGKSIPDAIRLSRRTAPPQLETELGVLVARLNNRWDTRDALMRFADALDSPDADGVVAALILASNRGSTGASTTLTALADSLQAQLAGRREVETERAKPFTVVRQVTIITGVTLGLAFAFGRDFFAPYGSPLGQVLLLALVSAYLGSLVVLRLRARTRPGDRILVGGRE